MDAAGNVEAVRTLTVRMDNQPPGRPTDLLSSPTGWTKGSTFTVTWKNPLPADDSGIAAVYYKLNGPPTGPTDGTRVAVVVPSMQINVTASGEHDLYIWLEDMAGNVWEWTHTAFESYPYKAGDGREFDDDTTPRVLRGGSFGSYPRFVRCAVRGWSRISWRRP